MCLTIFSNFFTEDTVVINAWRFLLRPEIHYTQVHRGSKTASSVTLKKKTIFPKMLTFFQPKQKCSCLAYIYFQIQFFCNNFYCFYLHCICYLTSYEFVTTKYRQFLVIQLFFYSFFRLRICAKRKMKCGNFACVIFIVPLPNAVKL